MTREELDKQLTELEQPSEQQKVIEPLTQEETGKDAAKTPDAGAPVEPVENPIEKVEAKPANDKLVEELTQKLSDLQARLDRQSGEFGGNLDKLRNQIREYNEAYAELKTKYDELSEKAKTPPTPPAKVVTDDMRDAFPDAAAAIEQAIASLRAELEVAKKNGAEVQTRAQRAEQSSVQVLESRFKDRLYGAVPDFDSINTTPGFKDFLAKPDRYGRTLLADLNAAWGSMNAEPIIEAVKEFKAGISGTITPVEDAEKKAKADADKAAKLKAETAPTAVAKNNKATSQSEEARERQKRMEAYKAKYQRDFTAISPAEMEQHKKDSEAEMKQKLSQIGHEL